MSAFANGEGPDEMQYHAAFHQGLHCNGENILRQYSSIMNIFF